jgi:hypothetical protein
MNSSVRYRCGVTEHRGLQVFFWWRGTRLNGRDHNSPNCARPRTLRVDDRSPVVDTFALIEAAGKAGETDESTRNESSTIHCGASQGEAHGDSGQGA